jgi:Zn-finger nucleic acid-binding protein
MATAHPPAPSVAVCPRCPGQTLTLQRRANVDIDVCPRCRGVWLDRYELETLMSDAIALERYAASLAEDGDGDLVPFRAPPSSARRRR